MILQWLVVIALVVISLYYLVKRLIGHFSAKSCDNCSACASIDFKKIEEAIKRDGKVI